jgi:hypothetical protein
MTDILALDLATVTGWAREDFRPGDLLCFSCTIEIADIHGQFVWGRA